MKKRKRTYKVLGKESESIIKFRNEYSKVIPKITKENRNEYKELFVQINEKEFNEFAVNCEVEKLSKYRQSLVENSGLFKKTIISFCEKNNLDVYILQYGDWSLMIKANDYIQSLCALEGNKISTIVERKLKEAKELLKEEIEQSNIIKKLKNIAKNEQKNN